MVKRVCWTLGVAGVGSSASFSRTVAPITCKASTSTGDSSRCAGRRFPTSGSNQVNPAPPTTLEAASFDVVTGYSVFSHLAERVSLAWVEELSRILNPGGFLFVTTHHRDFIEFCKSLRGKNHEFAWFQALANSFVDSDAAFAAYDAGEFLYAPTGGGPTLPSEFYGEALVSEAYVRRHWTKFLDFVAFIGDRAMTPQALIVMQKRV